MKPSERADPMNSMPTITETVVHNLAANGIQRIWGLPGDSLNAVTEAIRREKGIE